MFELNKIYIFDKNILILIKNRKEYNWRYINSFYGNDAINWSLGEYDWIENRFKFGLKPLTYPKISIDV